MKSAAIAFVALAALLAWQAAGESFGSVRLLISTPQAAMHFLVENRERFALDFVTTLAESIGGLLLSTVIAMAVLVASMLSRTVVAVVLPLALGVQVIPLIVFVPFVAMLFGVGIEAKIALASLVGVFPLVAIVIDAFTRIPSYILDLVKLYRVPRLAAVGQVFLPYLMPTFFSALRVCATLSVLGALVAEFTGARYGLGRNIFLASIRIEPELMVVSVGLCAILGASLFYAVKLIESAVVRWKA